MLYEVITVWDRFLLYMNTTKWSDKLPNELKGIYEEEKYANQQKYSRVNYKFGWLTGLFNLLVVLGMLKFDGFAFVDSWAASATSSDIFRSLIFFGVLGLGSSIINLPFSIYSTFVIEEQFEFRNNFV